METRDRKFAGSVFSPGSALILTVVLTGMLAIVGVLFVMMARVDKVATSAISENRELDLAVETVIAGISQQLVSDIPGVAGQEYYDYPDPCNAWLASLEPKLFDNGTPANPLDDLYFWPHITDLYGNNFGVPPSQNYYDPDDRSDPAQWDSGQPAISDWYLVSPYNVVARVVADHEKVDYTIRDMGDWNVYTDLCPVGMRADADADGIADSRWAIIPDMTSSKGEPILFAVRVIDNQGMFNVNTGFKFDPCDIRRRIDGSNQTQINLAALSQRGVNGTVTEAAEKLQNVRCGNEPNNIFLYEQNVVWRYQDPNGAYTPFDISDELELRNRFLLNHPDIDTRIEETWDNAFQVGKQVPFYANADIPEWYQRAHHEILIRNLLYSYRHIATTYNMDRIIDPMGGRMININNSNIPVDIPYVRYSGYSLDMNTPVGILYDRLLSSYLSSLGPVIPDPNIVTQYAQLAANIIDFSDDDDINNDALLDSNCVTTLVDPYGIVHIGFEAQPFISEIGIVMPGTGQFDKSRPPVQIDPGTSSFAVELYNPFDCNMPLRDFVLELFNRRLSDTRTITFDPCDVIYANSCFVISNRPQAFGLNPFNPNVIVRPELVLFTEPDKSRPAVPTDSSKYAYDILLKRIVNSVGSMIYVDKQEIYPFPSLDEPTDQILYLGRCVSDWHVVYQTLIPDTGTLGIVNNIPPTLFSEHNFSFFLPNPIYPRARFITVGDVPRVLTLGHSITPDSTIGEQLGTKLRSEEYLVRLDLQNPFHRNIFQYLTVFDPTRDFIDNDDDGRGIDLDSDGFLDIAEIDLDEDKIPGRININTAPWYVIAQLPWVSRRINPPLNYSLAQTIIAYRDKLPLPVDHSIGRYNAIIANSPLNDNFAASFAPWTVREQPGFASIGDLNFIIAGLNNFNVGSYALDTLDLPGFPDLTTYGPGLGDGIADDFEERDVIFSRVSNLVSVRSDVFTAYILVRIGVDGPQKRIVAILDRSGVNRTNFRSPDGKVRIAALHYLPDPR
jgi:hypothetical protein